MKTGCTIKTLSPELWYRAAMLARQLNPANAPSLDVMRLALPHTVLDPQLLALLTARYWGANGVRLTVGYLDNPPPELRSRILSHMNAWGNYSNVRFTTTSSDAQVRIARVPGDGYWSYLGTDILQIPAGRPTMNLDGFSMNTTEAELRQVVRHETGHTLGFPHEHLRADIINRIDRDKAIAYFAAVSGWTEQMVETQVLTPLAESALLASAQVDPNSIMCYPLPGSIMKDGVSVEGGLDIDAQDATFAASVYPGVIMTTSIWPNGKAYFFKGSKYVSYDVSADKVDAGYPAPIAGRWTGFPKRFEQGVDASIAWSNGKVCFFKGDQFLTYDMAADKVEGSAKSIGEYWPGLWTDGIDAAVMWPNGKAYFFKGGQYVRVQPETYKVDAGFPRSIKGSWTGFPDAFAQGIQAAVVWNTGKAYFFKGQQYVRYDIAADQVDSGYPLTIAGHWPGLWEQDLDA